MAKKLHVGNLSYSTTDTSLREFFSQAGTVTSAKVIVDRESGRSKGFGFVEMSNENEGANAIATLNGQVLDSRPVQVSEAKDQHSSGGSRRF